MATAVTENVLKQGYLKKSVQSSDILPSTSKLIAKNIKQKLEPSRWYVFGVRNRLPYLEFYDREERVFTGSPLQTYNLSSFQSISYTMGRTNTNYTFCIILREQSIELTAPSRTQMVEWCRCLERNLRNLGIRSKNQKEDHQYTAFPVRKKLNKPRPPDPPDSGTGSQSVNETEATQALTYEENLLVNFNADEEDSADDKDGDYADASMIVRDEPGADTEADTLPLRPPPFIPRRNTNEDIFVALSDIKRTSTIMDSSPNFAGQDHTLEEHEKELFSDADSESDSEHEAPFVTKLQVSNIRKLTNPVADSQDEDEDQITSLPNIGRGENVKPDPAEQSDTSEDSDFISASFWLRNRRPDLAEDGGTLPPTVPVRIDSAQPMPTPRSKPPPKEKMDLISLNESCTSPTTSTERSRSPTLLSLGIAPVPQPTSPIDSVLYDVPPPGSIDVDTGLYKIPPRQQSDMPVSGATGASSQCDSGEEDTGTYDTLVGGKGGIPVTPIDDLTQDDVYEATWQCSSSAKPQSSMGVFEYEKPVVQDNEMCESDQLRVDISDDTCIKKTVKNDNFARDSDNVKPKFRNKLGLSRLFSKKSKDKPLPESLVVDLPQCNQKTEQGTNVAEGNFYSDMPLPGEGEKPADKLDSDILKLSIANGPSGASNDPSPIELPKRNFGELTACSKVAPKQSPSQHDSMPLDLNLYEVVETCKDIPPSPPARSGPSKTAEFISRPPPVVPVAPPRKKKTLANGHTSMSKSFDSSSYGVQIFSGGAGVPVVERAERPRLPSPPGKREPAMPPRPVAHSPDTSKHEHSPPPVVLRNVPNIPYSKDTNSIRQHRITVHGGARPKTIHLAVRQQSVTSSASNTVTVMNLKQNQVDILRSEIESTGGLVKIISKVHFLQGLALVQCFERIWIAGWNVKAFPHLYDKFHIGDQLVSINDVQVTDIGFANKLVKNVAANSVEIQIRRVPYARVFAIQRSAEGESLGIKREGQTAEIVYLDPNGLAANHGLTSKAPTLDRSALTTWTLTEVNMRPLNLFPKDHEIEHRLLAVGKDISIVVQPTELVRELRKHLKKLKSHKDYLLH